MKKRIQLIILTLSVSIGLAFGTNTMVQSATKAPAKVQASATSQMTATKDENYTLVNALDVVATPAKYLNKKIMQKKLKRSQNKMISGVCAGIAEYFEFDPTLVRIAYVLLSFFSAGFPGLLLYIILAIVMPVQDELK